MTRSRSPSHWPRLLASLLLATGCLAPVHGDDIQFSGDAADLQRRIDEAPEDATVLCDDQRCLVISKTITIRKPLTLKGLKARLPDTLGRTPMIIVAAERVNLENIELHGNFDTVSQTERAPMIWVQKGRFSVRHCSFHDATKDGIMVTPVQDGDDIVDGSISDIQAFRMGRDAVSISGGNKGQKVRNVTVENVSLKRGYLRGSVEVSDGTDRITVRRVYAENARYAIDVQDHKGDSAANTNILFDDVEAVKCQHLIRTANSPRGHAHLTLRKLTARNCDAPVQISNTKHVTVEDLTIECKPESSQPPISLKNCQLVTLKRVAIKGLPTTVEPLRKNGSTDVTIDGLTREP